jgi:hypothetical protein
MASSTNKRPSHYVYLVTRILSALALIPAGVIIGIFMKDIKRTRHYPPAELVVSCFVVSDSLKQGGFPRRLKHLDLTILRA